MLKKLFSKSSSADLTAALDKARNELTAAEAAVETAEAAYTNGLLVETPVALRKLVDAKTEAGISADIAAAKIAKLEADLVIAQAAEAEVGRADAYARAEAMAATARKRLKTEYPKAALSLRSLLQDLADAEMAVQTVNADLPEGKAALAGPESERSTPALWKETLSETEVELWSGAGDSKPLPDEMQRRVTAYEVGRSRRDDDTPPTVTGVVRVDGGSSLEVVKRKFLRREILPDQSGWTAASLASGISLPALTAGSTPYFEPTSGRPGDVLAALSRPLLPRPEQPARAPEYEFTLLRN